MLRKVTIDSENYFKEIVSGKKFDDNIIELFLSRVSAFTSLVNLDGSINEQAKRL